MHVLGWVAIGMTGFWLVALAARGRRPAWSGTARRLPGTSRVLDAVDDLEAQVRGLGEVERFVLGELLHREPVARNPCAEFEAGLSLAGPSSSSSRRTAWGPSMTTRSTRRPKFDQLRAHQLEQLVATQERQQALLREIAARLEEA